MKEDISMKKGIRKTILPVTVAFVVAVALIFVPQKEPVHADMFKFIPYKSQIVITSLDRNADIVLEMGKRVKSKHKITVKSSKPSAVDVKKYDTEVDLIPKKPGKSTITIRNKTTKKTYTCTVTYMKYTNPFKTLKVGKKDMKKKMNTSGVYSSGSLGPKNAGYADISGFIGQRSGSCKVRVTAKKGWKVKKIQYKAFHFSDSWKIDQKITKTVKNNSMVKFKKSKAWKEVLAVTMYNKKYDATMIYNVCTWEKD